MSLATLIRSGRWLILSFSLGLSPTLGNASELPGSDLAEYLAEATPRRIEFQQQWWTYLDERFGGNADKLAEYLRASSAPSMFTQSCRNPNHAADFTRLSQAIATVMVSGNPRKRSPQGGTARSRFLSCMNEHGLQSLATALEVRFYEAVVFQRFIDAPFACRWSSPGSSQGATYAPAVTNQNKRQITWSMPLGQAEARKIVRDGSEASYASTFENVMLHELLHTVGPSGHELIHPTLACCGDVVSDRDKGCRELDDTVAGLQALHSVAMELGGVSLFAGLSDRFGQAELGILARRFYTLFVNFDIRNSAAGATVCGGIPCQQGYLDMTWWVLEMIFPDGCKKILPGKSSAACDAVTDADFTVIGVEVGMRFGAPLRNGRR